MSPRFFERLWIWPTITTTRRNSVECIRTPRNVEIGTVSLPASSRCVRVKWSRPITQTPTTPCSDHLQNLSNSSLVYILPILKFSRKSTNNFPSCSANKQTDKHGSKHYPRQPVAGSRAVSMWQLALRCSSGGGNNHNRHHHHRI